MASNNRFRVASTLGPQLQDLGVSLPAVLRHAGLPLSLFEQDKIWMTTAERFAFFRAIEEVSADPAIGLKMGNEERLERYNPVSITAIYCRTFRDAIERIARYKRLTGPQEIRLSQQGPECSVQFLWLLGEQEEPYILVDTCFSWLLNIGRRGTGRALRPVRVEFARPPAHPPVYEDYFGCPVRFGTAVNRMIFETSDIDRGFVTYNPDMLGLVAPQLDAELKKQLTDRSLPGQVKGVLKTLLPGQKPRVEEVAQEMRVSARTLQRRLQEEEVTFHGLIEEARREMSHHYLVESELDLTEIGYLLGYEDPNSFTRAFHRWEGTTPGAWRASTGARSQRRSSQFLPAGPLTKSAN